MFFFFLINDDMNKDNNSEDIINFHFKAFFNMEERL